MTEKILDALRHYLPCVRNLSEPDFRYDEDEERKLEEYEKKALA